MRARFGKNSSKHTAFQLQPIVLRLLLLVVGLLPFFPATASTLVPEQTNTHYSDQTDFLYAGIYSDLSANPLAPAHSGSLPLEGSDASEFPEEEDNSASAGHINTNFVFQAKLLEEIQLGQLAKGRSNSALIPFYILFHAWKSYLV